MYKILTCVALNCAISLPVLAQAPKLISHQGVLYEADTPVDGTRDLIVSIYAETHTGVSIADGIFDVILGSISQFGSLDFNQLLFLGVQIVGGGDELSPRTQLTAVPSAMTLSTPTSVKGTISGSGVGILTVANESTGPNGSAILAQSSSSPTMSSSSSGSSGR